MGSKLWCHIGLTVHSWLRFIVAFPKLGVLDLVTIYMYLYCYFLACNYSVCRWENRKKRELLDDARS